jgi:hypothetical protein
MPAAPTCHAEASRVGGRLGSPELLAKAAWPLAGSMFPGGRTRHRMLTSPKAFAGRLCSGAAGRTGSRPTAGG